MNRYLANTSSIADHANIAHLDVKLSQYLLNLACNVKTQFVLPCVLAYEEAVAWAPDVLSAGGSVPDGRRLVAVGALHHMLVTLTTYINHVLKKKSKL